MDQHPQKQSQDVEYRLTQMNSARTLVLIALFAAPISLLFGGVLLSLGSVILSIIALSKVRSILTPEDVRGTYPRILYFQCILSLVFGITALIVNAVFMSMALPVVIDMMRQGDLNSILDQNTSSSQSISTWDR